MMKDDSGSSGGQFATRRQFLKLVGVTGVLALASPLLLQACAQPTPASPTAAPAAPTPKAAEPTKAPAAQPTSTTAPAAQPTPTKAPAPQPTEPPASQPTATTAAATSGEMKAVPRERTLIVMQGGDASSNPEYNTFNNYTTSYVNGWCSGPVQTLGEPLIMFTVLTGDYENWLAETWEYNADFTEITMKLRKGIEWSDGTPFTAKDVAFTFNVLRKNQDKVVHAAEISFLKEAVAVDDLTVKFVLTKANPRWWVTTLTSSHGISQQIFPEHIWKDKDILTFGFYDPEKGWPIGTGPYRLVSTSPEQKIFDRRDDWWAAKTGFKQLSKVERVIYIPTRDETMASQMLSRGEIDMAKILTVPTIKSLIAENPKVTMFTGHEPPYGYLDWCPISLGFNNTAAPYDDKDIRWAINYAIDRDNLAEIAEAGAGVVALHQFTPYGWFEPFEAALKPLYQKYGLDTKAHTDRTEQMMTAKGYAKDGEGLWVKDGARVTMKIFVPDWLKTYGPPISQQLRDAGFDAVFDITPGLFSQVQTGEQPVFCLCQGPSGVKGMDPYYMLSLFTSEYFRPTGQPAATIDAISRWKLDKYDLIVKEMSPLKVEDPKTMELFTQAMDIWFENMPMIYVSQLIIRYPMTTQYWKGWPSKEDAYGFPHSWQQEFQKTILRLEPA